MRCLTENSEPRSIAVDVSHVAKVFGAGDTAVAALEDVSVGIRENEFFTLLGPSGCGKTTLLRLIAGFEHPTSGRIRLHGEDIAHLPPFQRPVNTVFQSYALFPHMSVAENIGFGLEMRGLDRASVRRRVGEMLEIVKLGHLGERLPRNLSGGQQQRVALARALAIRPDIVLLDEPLSNLDASLRADVARDIRLLQREHGFTRSASTPVLIRTLRRFLTSTPSFFSHPGDARSTFTSSSTTLVGTAASE